MFYGNYQVLLNHNAKYIELCFTVPSIRILFVVEIDFKMTFVSSGLGCALAVETIVCIIMCCKGKQRKKEIRRLKKEIRTKYIKKEPDNIIPYGVKFHPEYRQHCPEDSGRVSLVILCVHKQMQQRYHYNSYEHVK